MNHLFGDALVSLTGLPMKLSVPSDARDSLAKYMSELLPPTIVELHIIPIVPSGNVVKAGA
jgi:hypothetical protein